MGVFFHIHRVTSFTRTSTVTSFTELFLDKLFLLRADHTMLKLLFAPLILLGIFLWELLQEARLAITLVATLSSLLWKVRSFAPYARSDSLVGIFLWELLLEAAVAVTTAATLSSLLWKVRSFAPLTLLLSFLLLIPLCKFFWKILLEAPVAVTFMLSKFLWKMRSFAPGFLLLILLWKLLLEAAVAVTTAATLGLLLWNMMGFAP